MMYLDNKFKWLNTDNFKSKVFISYSHKDFGNYVDFLTKEFEKNNVSYWLDLHDISLSSKWEREIENGIIECDYFLFFMTKLSVDRENGYCINEIAYARQYNKVIIPIKIEEVLPLIGFVTLQHLDLTNVFACDENGPKIIDLNKFDDKINQLLNLVLNKVQLPLDSGFAHLSKCLKPVPQEHYFVNKRIYCYDRIQQELDKWISMDLRESYYEKIYSKNIIALVAPQGIGKSSFMSYYCQLKEEIVGINFCKANCIDRGDTKRVLMSLAFSLARYNSEYRFIIDRDNDIERLEDMSPSMVFETLFVKPLQQINNISKNLIFVLDGLDEISDLTSQDSLAKFIVDKMCNLNIGIRFIVTMRKDSDVCKIIDDGRHTKIKKIIPSEEDIEEAIKAYLNDRLSYLKTEKNVSEASFDTYVQNIVKKANNSFLYASVVAEELLSYDNISISDIERLPTGISNMYIDKFQKIFNNNNSNLDYENAKNVLMVLSAQHQRLTISQIATFLKSYGMDKPMKIVKETLALLDSFVSQINLKPQEATDMTNDLYGSDISYENLREEDKKIAEFTHSSFIDWIKSYENAKDFYIDLSEAHKIMATHYDKCVEDGELNKYCCNFYISHLIGANRHDDAIHYLCDIDFQKKREQIISIDNALLTYLKELFKIASIPEISKARIRKIFESEVFIGYIGKYRKFFYNQASSYKKLKDIGFDSYADDLMKNVNADNIKASQFDFYTAIIDFFYINEAFVKTAKYSKLMIKYYSSEIPEDIRMEIYKMLVLSYRKRGKFSKSIEYAEKCIELCNDPNLEYDCGVVKLALGKIKYHSLNFKDGEECISSGIINLLNTLKINNKENNEDFDDEDFDDEDFDDDIILDDDLDSSYLYDNAYDRFIKNYVAAFKRELVLLYLWNKQYDEAYKTLNEIEQTYADKEYIIDRYYVRYQYAKMFYYICNNEHNNAIKLGELALQNANSNFVKSQIYFFTSLAYYCIGEDNYALSNIDNAINLNQKDFFERFEIRLLKNIIEKKITNIDEFNSLQFIVDNCEDIELNEANEPVSKNYDLEDIKCIADWIHFVCNYLLELVEKYK